MNIVNSRRTLAIIAALVAAAAHANDVVISQVYGGGGNAGAPWRNDFVELVNRTASPVAIGGWSIQYSGANADRWQLVVIPASVVLSPGHYYLVQLNAGTAGGAPLPQPDLTGSLSLGASAGKVALVRSPLALAGACPSSNAIADFLGYGEANCAMGASPAPTLGNALAATRLAGGCLASGINAADFAALAPAPRTSATPPVDCANAGSRVARIREIQGRAHRSPLLNEVVRTVPGIVTLVRGDGFFMQDASPDDDPLTSEGILVSTVGAPSVAIGDAVEIDGRVDELRANGNTLSTTRIIATGIVRRAAGQALPEPIVIGAAGRLPPGEAYAAGRGNIELAPLLDPQSSALDFYETLEGMRVQIVDAVAAMASVAVDPERAPGTDPEVAILPDDGRTASGPRSRRGSLVVSPSDFNPERLALAGANGPLPRANVGDSFGTVTGVLTWFAANPGVLASEAGPFVARGLAPESTLPQASGELAIAAYNVENLDPSDPPAKFAAIGMHIARNLAAPDIVGLVEVQDNSGAVNDGTVAADQTLARVIDAIIAAGGPRYAWRAIDPEDGRDGGEPGGNIRTVFLFNPARVAFVDRPGGSATQAVQIVSGPDGAALSQSPGRIDPANTAWRGSRKPLAAEFSFNGRRIIAILVHLNAKTGDQPLAGRFQPPFRQSETQRAEQANVLAGFIRDLLAVDPDARLALLGDFNDFGFSDALGIIQSAGVTGLGETLPPEERYSFNFEGNAQAIDHVLVSPVLANAQAQFDIVHVNTEFLDRASDHDPVIARFALAPADLTAAIGVRRFRSSTSNNGRAWSTLFRLTNRLTQPIYGPLQLVLDRLPAAIAIQGAAGTLDESPYVTVPNTSLAAGASVDVRVNYTAPVGVTFSYAARVFAGRF